MSPDSRPEQLVHDLGIVQDWLEVLHGGALTPTTYPM